MIRRTGWFRLSWLTWPAGLLVCSSATAVLALADVRSPLRVLVSLSFLLVCPGMAIVRHWRLRAPIVELALATGLSVALATLVAGVMLYAGVWSMELGLLLLAGITVAGAALEVARGIERGTEE